MFFKIINLLLPTCTFEETGIKLSKELFIFTILLSLAPTRKCNPINRRLLWPIFITFHAHVYPTDNFGKCLQ